ncbi:MAG TPA: retroviral-like aspartic protease family protein, partial [Chroococcales cyanobacterium]
IQIAPSSAAAGYARTALAAMTPGARSATPSSARSVASVSSASAATPDDDDMRNLPDRASFYFTKESGGHMAVNVMINGHQVPCLFDTGAGAFFYKDQLVAAGVDCNKARPAGQTRGWAGTPVPIFAMPAEVRLGNLTRTIMITMEESASGLNKNLIGQTMIQGYQYEIDDKGGRVDLKKTISNTEQRVDSLYDVPLTVEGSRDIIMIEVNGHKVPAFIDTGSAFTIVNSSTAQACGIESTGTQGMMGVGGALTVGVGTAKIRLGPISKEFTVRIGGSAGCCIGQDFMEGWRFKTDREHGLLRFFH